MRPEKSSRLGGKLLNHFEALAPRRTCASLGAGPDALFVDRVALHIKFKARVIGHKNLREQRTGKAVTDHKTLLAIISPWHPYISHGHGADFDIVGASKSCCVCAPLFHQKLHGPGKASKK